MPKSRPRPVSHFRGVITSSTTTTITTSTSTGSAFVRHQQEGGTIPAASPPIQTQSETTSTGTNVRFGPGGGGGVVVGSGLMGGIGSPGIRGISGSNSGGGAGGRNQQQQLLPAERALLPGASDGGRDGEGGGRGADGAARDQQRMVEEARQRGRTTGNNEQLMRMGRCSQLFEENYCLNGGKCHNFTIANSTMPTCECADGFMGERCESKYLDGTYLSMRKPKIHIETASVYYGAFLALMVLLVVFYYLHLFQHCRRNKGGRFQEQQQQQQQLVPLPSPVHQEQLSRNCSSRLISPTRA